jgi:DNA-binding response OmpR family regulator
MITLLWYNNDIGVVDWFHSTPSVCPISNGGTTMTISQAQAPTILTVDDEPGTRYFLLETLESEGYRIVSAESGEQALELIARQEFDLVLLDLRMREVGGIDVLRTLVRHSPDTTAIVLTGYGSLETAVEALRNGAHDYLFKPCEPDQLRESVRTGLHRRQRLVRQRELLDQLERNLHDSLDLESVWTSVVERAVGLPPSLPETPRADNCFLKRGGLVIDLVQHVITLDGRPLELSPTEFDLVRFLVSQAPGVVSPAELVREVQGFECEPWEASDMIRYHVYRIRQKMKEQAGRADVIRTVRGVGYSIKE